MAGRECQNCGRIAASGFRCNYCACEIVARALTSQSGGRHEKVHRPLLAIRLVQVGLIG